MSTLEKHYENILGILKKYNGTCQILTRKCFRLVQLPPGHIENYSVGNAVMKIQLTRSN